MKTQTTNELVSRAKRLQKAGQLDDASEVYGEIIRIDRSHTVSTVPEYQADKLSDAQLRLLQLAEQFEHQNRLGRAIACYHVVYAAAPGNLNVALNLGRLLKQQGHASQAIPIYERAIQIHPNDVPLHVNLGSAHQSLGNIEQALTAYRHALQLDPACAEAWFNLGLIHKEHSTAGNAVECFERAAASSYLYAASHCELGLIQREANNLQAAISHYESALSVDPEFAEARFNRALALLASGQFYEGWTEYESRWSRGTEQRRDFGLVEWKGESLLGRTLVIAAEQGLGDELMFASLVPEVAARARRCILECHHRLVRLFQRSFPNVSVFARSDKRGSIPSEVFAPRNLQTSLGSLPGLLGIDFSMRHAIEPALSYLKVDKQQQSVWQEHLRTGDHKAIVGISWSGGSTPQLQAKRSASLSHWMPVLRTDAVQFVSLQHGQTAAPFEAAAMDAGITLRRFPGMEEGADLDTMATLISALDLVITVDNTTAHLAGALDVSVWNLLPYAPDWRWMLDGETTPWYRSMRLYRQPSAGNWADVFDRVARQLQTFESHFRDNDDKR